MLFIAIALLVAAVSLLMGVIIGLYAPDARLIPMLMAVAALLLAAFVLVNLSPGVWTAACPGCRAGHDETRGMAWALGFVYFGAVLFESLLALGIGALIGRLLRDDRPNRNRATGTARH